MLKIHMIPDYENLNAIKEFNTMFLFKQTMNNNKISKDIWHIKSNTFKLLK